MQGKRLDALAMMDLNLSISELYDQLEKLFTKQSLLYLEAGMTASAEQRANSSRSMHKASRLFLEQNMELIHVTRPWYGDGSSGSAPEKHMEYPYNWHSPDGEIVDVMLMLLSNECYKCGSDLIKEECSATTGNDGSGSMRVKCSGGCSVVLTR